jgi:hypothetical protein
LAKNTSPLPRQHQRHALAGDGLLEHAADAAGTLVLEVDLALEGDHRALAGHHVAVEGDPEHAGALQGEGLARGDLKIAAEQIAPHLDHLLARAPGLGTRTPDRGRCPASSPDRPRRCAAAAGLLDSGP